MNCKKCGKELTAGGYREVADWHFCPECFEELFKEAETRKTESPAADRSGTDTQQDASGRQCRVCHTPIEAGEGQHMLGLLFCAACYEALVARPVPQPRPDADEPEEEKGVAQVRVDVNASVQCHGCGRTIPAIGGKNVGGKPYCPECYYALPPASTEAPEEEES